MVSQRMLDRRTPVQWLTGRTPDGSKLSNEIHEALKDISRRPTPDRTGAIQHSIAAMECTAREVAGEPNLTPPETSLFIFTN